VFKRQDADVVGIQEGLDQQLKDIEAAVPGYTRVGVGRDDGKTKGEYSAIYYRTSRFDLDASGTFWFSDTPEVVGSKTWGNDLPRICTWAHLVEKTTGYGFYQFNVHLDAYVQVAREKSAVLLMQRFVARPVAADPAIVTGDFNAGESNTVNQYMRGAASIESAQNPLPLADSFRVLHPNDTDVGTSHGFKGGTSGAKIDYIYLMPGETALAAEIDHTHDGARYPSDHYPVTATVKLPTKP
jgi:endonuclease/exonuclease/phosphatase family metal-dependent hydrolase